MNGPSGCEALPPASAAMPSVLGIPANGEESALSFEEVLDEETSEASESESEDTEDIEKAMASPLFPLFTPPLILFAQATAPPLREEESVGGPSVPEPVEHKLPPPPQPMPSAPEQIAEKSVLPKEKNDGMYAANESTMVFTNSSDEEGSAAAKEKLPLGIEYIDTPGFEKNVKVEAVTSRQIRRGNEATEAILNHPAPAGPTRLDTDFSSHDLSPLEEPHRLALRTAEGIGGHVQFLRTTGQDRLEVVLRPDGATQLHLQITKADGLIHVRVRCDRGDFNALDANWTTVQSSLAAQGIRVESLQTGLAFDTHSQGRQGASQREQEQAARPELFFEQDTPSKNPGRPASKPLPGQGRGWQRWA